jgi:hypothetical protein
LFAAAFPAHAVLDFPGPPLLIPLERIAPAAGVSQTEKKHKSKATLIGEGCAVLYSGGEIFSSSLPNLIQFIVVFLQYKSFW